MGFSDYNSNPDLNTSISGVNIGEGCPPSGINNAMRQIMADAKAFTGGAVLSGGVTIKGGATVSGGLVVSGGSAGMSMATGNVYFSKTATISGSTVSHNCQLTMNASSLNFGLYDQTHSKWVVMGSANGDAFIEGPLAVGSGTTIGGRAVVSGGAVISGTLDLPNSTDAQGTGTNAPALRVGPVSGVHLELDGNEIMAKTTSNTVNTLSLNGDGGLVYVGSGGLRVAGGGATVSGGATVNGSATLKNGLAVSGGATISGALTVSGNISGTCSAADSLASPQYFRVDLGKTSAVQFDGTAACYPGVFGVLGVGHGGTGMSSLELTGNSIKLPGGLIMKWGTVSATNTGKAVTFNTTYPFTSAPHVVISWHPDTVPANLYVCAAYNVSTTGFTAYGYRTTGTSTSTTMNCYWVAIGK